MKKSIPISQPVNAEGNLKEINGNIERIEGKYPFIATTLIGVLGVLPKLLENVDGKVTDIIYWAFPFVFMLVLSYVADLFRQVAVLRGYASYLEEVINDDQKRSLQLWNSTYIDKLIQNNGTNILIMLSSSACFAFALYGYFSVFLLKVELKYRIAVIVYIFLGLILFIRHMSLNDRIRRQSYWVAKTKNEDIYRVLLFSECKRLIAESGVGKVLSLQIKALGSQENVYYTTDKKEFYNIVHINTFGIQSYLLAKKCRRKGIPVIITTHTIVEDFKNSFIGTYNKLVQKLFRWWIKRFYSHADQLISPTKYVERLLKGGKYDISVPIEVISNGVDNDLFAKSGNKKERKAIIRLLKRKNKGFTIKNSDKIILSVGLYLERKGIEEFVKLAEQVKEDKTHADWKFVWFGHTNELFIPTRISKAKNRAKKMDNIVFPGYVDHKTLAKVYRNSDVVLMMTKEETECLVVLEALSSRVPLVVRNIDVFKGWLSEGACRKFGDGSSKDDKAQSEEIVKILEDTFDKDNKDMLDQGAKIAQERDLKISGQKLSNLYLTVYRTKKAQKEKQLIE